MRTIIIRFTLASLILLLTTGQVQAFNMGSISYSVEGGSFDTSGGESSSSNFLLYGFSGEDYLTAATSNNFSNNPGLLFFPSPKPNPSSSSTSISTSTVATPTPTSAPVAFAPITVPQKPGKENETGAPSQLFDIALILDDPLVEDSRKLKARVTFVSFGTEATPVDMEFIVLGTSGQELYRTTGQTVIQTEGIYNQTFTDLVVPNGKYTLVLKTLYNVDVRDEFRQPFEVKSSQSVLSWLWPWGVVNIFLIVLLALLIILIKKRHKKNIRRINS